MAVTEPDFGIGRILVKELLVDLARAFVLADSAEDDSAQVSITWIARIDSKQTLDFLECLGGVVLPMQQRGVVVACRSEARRQFETP